MEHVGRRAAARAAREARQQQPVVAGAAAAGEVGRRAARRAVREAQAAQQPPLAAPARNDLPPEVHLSGWKRGNSNHSEMGKKTTLPPRVPSIEAIRYQFEKIYKTGDEVVDAYNKDLIDLFNQTVDQRGETYHWLVKSESPEVLKEVTRCGHALAGLSLKIGLKEAQIRAAEGTPIERPKHFKNFPKLLTQ